MGWKTTIENLSDYVISGSDYEVTCTFIRWNKTFPGQDIQPGETRSFTMMVEPNEGVLHWLAKVAICCAPISCTSSPTTPNCCWVAVWYLMAYM